MELIIAFAILGGLFWVGFHITGAIISALFWLFFKLPLAIIVFCFGIALCCTLIFIPFGLKCFSLAAKILF